MTTKKSRRTNSGAAVTKWFVTAASVAAMLGGWAVFSSQPATSEANVASQTLATELGLEPIPTLVPAPDDRQRTTLSNDNNEVQTNLSTLRTVSTPQQRPITVTRSSR